MNTFIKGINDIETKTTNGMKAFKSSSNALVDLFYKIGSARQIDIVPHFIAAFIENPEIAGRIALWARDAREGAGERETFRKILRYLNQEENSDNKEYLNRLLNKVPELGRFDDLLSVNSDYSYKLFMEALNAKNGLAFKWAPRVKSAKKEQAEKLRKLLGLTPKQYRKFLVEGTKVVETQMCSKLWNEINYSHVPSVASARYQKAFNRHDTERYQEWRNKLKTGETKVNASVLYPYDVIKSIRNGDKNVALAQWEALPDYCNGSNVLPMIDVSGSMTMFEPVKGITGLDIAMSLGLYLADKNKGPYKDTFLTFSTRSDLVTLKGDLLQKITQLSRAHWEGSTNLHAAFETILKVAVKNHVCPEDMPETVLILSDMQFNLCVRYDDSAYEMINRKYTEAGYKVPHVIFWNLCSNYNNTPVQANEQNVSLVSGFSPSIMKSILSCKNPTPYETMIETVMRDRYNF